MFKLPVDPDLPRVAVVEDEADLRASVVDFLRLCRYPAWGAGSGAEFFHLLAENPVDVVILDIQLPDTDGFSIARQLDADRQELGIVIVSARGAIDDRLAGLSSGADVYLVKPVDFRELIANIQSVFRRLSRLISPPQAADAANQSPCHSERLSFRPSLPPVDESGCWLLDLHTWCFHSPERKILQLTPKEFLFIRTLVEASDQVVTRKRLAIALNGEQGVAVVSPHAIDVLVGRLRKKFLEKIQQFAPIKTVTGIGFSLTVPARIRAARHDPAA